MTSSVRVPARSLLVAAVAAPALAASPASAELIFGLTTQNSVTVFDSDDPRTALDGDFVTGLEAGDTLLAIDYRPATEEVYLVGSRDNLYTLDQNTFEASLVGSFSPSVPGTSYAFDFNPAFSGGQFARLINELDDNRVIDGDTGAYLAPVEKTDVFYAAGDPNAGVNPNIAGIAYTNSLGVPTSTQQYGIDATQGVLVTVANNAGELQTIGTLGVSGLSNELGLDISGFSGVAYANLQNSANSGLYTVDLATGAATFQGTITSGDLIRDITVIPVPEPTTAAVLGLGGLALLRRRR